MAAGLFSPIGGHAATIPVTTGNDSGAAGTCTLRQAVVALNAASVTGTACVATGTFGTNDTVDLTGRTGTITLAGTEIPVVVAMSVVGPGASTLTVSANNQSRVFNAFGGSTLSVSDVTIANGLAPDTGTSANDGAGGCILAQDVTLTRSVVTGCTAQTNIGPTDKYAVGLGGGVAANTVRLVQTTVSGNTAASGGGGVFGYYVSVTSSVVSGNSVTPGVCTNPGSGSKYCLSLGGGGILAGTATLARSEVSGNTVNAAVFTPSSSAYVIGIGGGVTAIGKYSGPYTAALIMSDSTIANNVIQGPGAAQGQTSKYAGGGAFSFGGTTITNSTVSGNSVGAGGLGAAMAIASSSTTAPPALANSTFTGNTGASGVLITCSGLPLVKIPGLASIQSRLAARAPLQARTPKIALSTTPTGLTSMIIANTLGSGAVDLAAPDGPCAIPASKSLVKTPDSSLTLPPSILTGVDPRLGSLANNGGAIAGAPGQTGTGPTRTHLLLAGSPAINTGSNPDNLPFDQRGSGFPRVAGPAADMGATEAPSAAAIPALGPWPLTLLSALVGLFGIFRRRR